MLNNFSPVQVLGLGVVGGFLILCTIGFFILLNIQLSGGALATGSQAQQAAEEGSDTLGAAPTAPQPPAEPEVVPTDVDLAVDRIRGNKNAKITIIEYSDIECPFCFRFHNTMKQVMDKYGNDVRWVYRHNPLSFHANARPGALAQECAGKQGKFWELTDYMFDIVGAEGKLTRTQFNDYAKAAGLNITQFQSCLDSQEFASKVSRDQADVPRKGTPYSIIQGPNGESIPINGAQPFEVVDAQIQQLL